MFVPNSEIFLPKNIADDMGVNWYNNFSMNNCIYIFGITYCDSYVWKSLEGPGREPASASTCEQVCCVDVLCDGRRRASLQLVLLRVWTAGTTLSNVFHDPCRL